LSERLDDNKEKEIYRKLRKDYEEIKIRWGNKE
jgi:hypothetical protein